MEDDGLAVEREADVQLDGIGAVGLGAVEALEGVFGSLRARPAVADDPRGALAEEVHRGWIILADHASPPLARRRHPGRLCRGVPSPPPRPRPFARGRARRASSGRAAFQVPISTIDWLVSRESPAARFVALRDLLGRPAKDPDVKRARQAVPRDPWTRDALAALRQRTFPGVDAPTSRAGTTGGSG